MDTYIPNDENPGATLVLAPPQLPAPAAQASLPVPPRDGGDYLFDPATGTYTPMTDSTANKE